MTTDPYMDNRFGGTSLCAIRQAPRQHCEMKIVEDLANAVMDAEARVAELEHELEVLRDVECMAKGAIKLGAERTLERDRLNAALTRIRTEDLSRFDCTLIAAEAQGLLK